MRLDICLGLSSLDILNRVFCPSPSPSPEYAGLNIDANRVGYFELGVLVFLPAWISGYMDVAAPTQTRTCRASSRSYITWLDLLQKMLRRAGCVLIILGAELSNLDLLNWALCSYSWEYTGLDIYNILLALPVLDIVATFRLIIPHRHSDQDLLLLLLLLGIHWELLDNFVNCCWSALQSHGWQCPNITKLNYHLISFWHNW